MVGEEMNLIERLGGYEDAKAFVNATSYTVDELLMMQRSGIRTKHVEDALLQYRREHNIFEVGDDIVYVHSHFDSSIMTLRKVSASGLPQRVREHDNGVSIYDVRHATDAEIKAGKRL